MFEAVSYTHLDVYKRQVLVTFKGKGGHAAFPHEANDALVAASYFITQVQTIVSRNVDPIQGLSLIHI